MNVYYTILQVLLVVLVCLTAIDVWEILPAFEGNKIVHSDFAWFWAIRDILTILLFIGLIPLAYNLRVFLNSSRNIVVGLLTLWFGARLILQLYADAGFLDVLPFLVVYGVLVSLIYAATERE